MADSAPTQSEIFFAEALDLIGLTTVSGALYGIIFGLYCLCARSLYLQLKVPHQKKQSMFTLAYASLVVISGLFILAANTRKIQLAYVNHADFPGGPLNYEAVFGHQSLALAGIVFAVVVDLLTMGIQVGFC